MIIAVAVLVAPMVVAQGAGVRQGGQGAQGQGRQGAGFGGGRIGMRGGGAALLMRADVQTELKLTDQQKTALREKMGAMAGGARGGGARGGGGGAGGGAGAGGGRGQGGGQGAGQMAQQMNDAVKSVLNDTQYKRYTELELQWTGPSALAREDVGKQVGITPDQQTKIRDIQRAEMEKIRGQFQGGGGAGGDRTAMQENMRKVRDSIDKQVLALLNDGQKAKWNALLGKAFKFDPPR